MDKKTIGAYDQSATQIAALHNSLVPIELYEIINRFFIPNGRTIDVGCGIGRDSNWLSKQGYEIVGIDASKQMLSHAEKKYPGISFITDSLPVLANTKDCSFTNVLCSAVIMHLEAEQISQSVTSLLRIMVEGGVIVLSFRGTDQTDKRENSKLYTPIEADELIESFSEAGASLQLNEHHLEQNRLNIWYYLVFKKAYNKQRIRTK